MADRAGPMSLGLFIMHAGHHFAAWRHPDAAAEGMLDLDYYVHLARTAEAARFDMVFLADTLMLGRNIERRASIDLDPIEVLSALSAVTTHIGLAGTISTSYSEPFNVARRLATLDILSKGRAGWNIVTSVTDLEARNFNRSKHFDHAERYARAAEFLDVVRRFWDSWQDDAIVADKQSGVFVDLHRVGIEVFSGKYFAALEPSNIPRPPQGHPIILQAGSSPSGRAFAARASDVVFTVTPTLEEAREFHDDVKARVVAAGRRPQDVKILSGVIPVVGRSRQEAEEKLRRFDELIDVQAAVRYLSFFLEHDLSVYPVDGPMPKLAASEQVQGQRGRYRILADKAEREQLTVRQLSLWFSGFRGHFIAAGTVQDVADQMQHWFDAGVCDGFNIMPTHLPGGFDEFVAGVVPELQKRGLLKREYAGRTLRDNLGLRRPAGRGPR